MSRSINVRYPNAPDSWEPDAVGAWNQLIQILSLKDRQQVASGLYYYITTASPVPTSATLTTTSASYTVTATTNALIKLINDLKKSGVIG